MSVVDRLLNMRERKALSRSMLSAIIILLFLTIIPYASTSSNGVRMTMDVQQKNSDDISAGYSITLHLINNVDNASLNNITANDTSLNNSLDGVDFSTLYELVVIRGDGVSVYNGSVSNDLSYSYKYFGKLQFPITYDITEYGRYTFRLSKISGGSPPSEVSFNYEFPNTANNTGPSSDFDNNTNINPASASSNETSSNPLPSNSTTLNVLDKCSNVFTKLDKKSYTLGETVQIIFSNIFGKNVNTDLTIYTRSLSYKFVGDLSDAAFVPPQEGNYTITLSCDDTVIYNETFRVDAPIGNPYLDSSVQNLPYSSSNSALNSIHNSTNNNTAWKKVVIRDSKGKSVTKSVRLNKVIKLHKVLNNTNGVLDINGTAQENVSAGNLSTTTTKSTPSTTDVSSLNLSDISSNISSDGSLNVSSTLNISSNETLSNDSMVNNSLSNDSLSIAESVSIGLSEIGGTNTSIQLDNLVLDANKDLDLYIEDVPTIKVKFKGDVLASFAMDLSNLNFTNGTFTKTAVGKELWKCAGWNFNNQSCNGSWIKVMDIRPGFAYDLPVSPEDPGYIETGVATINTMKSLYFPNDDVDIVMVVLDTQGYLVRGADVILTIIAPDNTTTIVTTNDSIISTHKGVYEVGFTGTSHEGNYTMIVKATGENINSTMTSQFTVSSVHPFEIQRYIPVTIDPTKGPYDSTIVITTSLPISSFDYTESLPSSFNITDLGGGIESIVGEYKYITWFGLKNDSVIKYSAQTPLDTPNVYQLGPGLINYTYATRNDATRNNTFYESRPWFLAIDPLFSGTFFMLWDGSTNAPPGWVCVSCNPGDPFYGRFIMGDAIYGNASGAAVHNHTIIYSSITSGDPNITRSSNNVAGGAAPTHTHAGIAAATTAPASNYPLFRQLKVIAYNGTSIPNYIPAGAIGIFNTTTLPANWTAYNSENGYFIFANATANLTGGSNTHNHTFTVTTAASAGALNRQNGNPQGAVAATAHTHTASGNTNSSSNVPLYIDVILAEASVNTTIPYGQGFIGMFNGTVGDGWVNMSQPGQPFYDKIIRANSTYGNTGGSNNNTHVNVTVITSTTSANTTSNTGGAVSFAGPLHTHDLTVGFNTSDNTPPYNTVVFGYANTYVAPPPTINSTDCYKNGTGWINCANIKYNDVITAYRVNCTSSFNGPAISNVSLLLYNVENNYTYLNATTSDNSTGYWLLNNTAAMIYSGNYSMDIICRDTVQSTNQDINWSLPWGNLSLNMISPKNNLSVIQNWTFNFTVNVSCIGGQCGNTNITLASVSNGLVPLNSGTPFYTTTANPMLPANNACLGNMSGGKSCNVTWIVNATGAIGNSWLLYANVSSLNFRFYVGNDTSSNINLSIVSYISPAINVVQCYKQGTGWIDCTNILFNSNFTDIRANCTTGHPIATISNVSFEFINLENNITYFNTTTSTMLSGYWYYNVTDILIQNSGFMNLEVICTDNSNVQTVQYINWTVPWGNISTRLISPNSTMNITQNRFFNFSVNISCLGGQCGDASIVLDPTNSWWDGRWMYRRLINVTNINNYTAKQNYSVKIVLDTTGSSMMVNGSDVRIVFYNGSVWTEIDRVNQTSFNNVTTEIWFRLQSDIAAHGYNDNYYVYYGNRFAGDPPANKSKVYLWFDDFNRADKADITTESSYGEIGDGGWAISGNRLLHTGGTTDPIKLRVLALGSSVDDVDMKMKINVSVWAGGADTYRFGFSQDMDDVGGAGRGYNGLLRNTLNQFWFLNDMVSWSGAGATTSAVTLNNWYYLRYQSINITNPTARMKAWSATTAEPPGWNYTGNYGTNNRGKGYVGIIGAEIASAQVYIDDLQIRYVLPNEPNTTLSAQEQGGKGDVPMYSGTPFYTTSTNPVYPANNSCLANMTAGKSCSIIWAVNATGNVNTTWNFFTFSYSLNLSSYVLPDFSQSVDINIIGNIPPITRSVSISPDQPVYYEDLNCTFNITDQNNGDLLSATVNWYRNGAFATSQTVNVTDGLQRSSILDSSYLTIGDIWNCGVVPFDTVSYGQELLSGNVTILATAPPNINNIQCLKNGAIWGACSNIVYGSTVSKVRANCTSRLSYPVSVTFNLTNIEDANRFFSGSTSDNSSGYWVFDNPDVNISDSGTFNLSVSCIDINGTTGINYTNWTVPWGVLSVNLINPNVSSNVTLNKFFNFTSQVTCVGGECGFINATIDPVNWWNNSWNYRRKVNLTENANQNLTDYQFGLNISTQALIAAGKMNNDCSDIRFVTNNSPSTQLYYWIASGCNTPTTIIWVKYNLSALDFDTIYMYYGNPVAPSASDPKSTMFIYENMSVAPDASIIGDAHYVDNNTGVRMTTAAGNLLGYIYYSANPGPGFYGRYETWAGGGSGADSTWIGVYDTSVSSTREDIVYGGYHFTVDEWQDRIAFTKSTGDNGGSIAEWGSTTLDNAAWHIYETYFYDNGTSANALIYYDGTLRVNGTDNAPQNLTGQYFLFGARTGGSTNEHRIRGIQVRKYVRPEPTVGVELEVAQVKGDIPMNSGTPFYTTTANPMLPANTSCLANMKSGNRCNTTWAVNATGMLYIPWEFFVTYASMNYSGKVLDNFTNRINITIIGNIAPLVSSITLTPSYPLPSENLNCTFIITDTNVGDILTANFTWYKNNAIFSNFTLNVTSGVPQSVILGSGNLTLGDIWKCGVTPYDQTVYGTPLNSSNQTIVNSKPPSINKLECLINNSIWTNCSKLSFYSNFSGVRVNCTTSYKHISNVTFNFSNIPSNILFFQNTTYTNTSALWSFYTNVTINNSGDFMINAVCMNNESAYDSRSETWTVPWGKIVLTLIDPSSDGYVEYDRYFNFTTQVQCVGGECGNVSTILDPNDIAGLLEHNSASNEKNDKVKTYKPTAIMIESSGYNSDLTKAYSYYQSKRLLPSTGNAGNSVETTGTNAHEINYPAIPDGYVGLKYAGNEQYPKGLITVNTNKPDYKTGDFAELYAVMLDDKGDLSSDDNLSAIVTGPDDTQIDLLNDSISESRSGLYVMKTAILTSPGKYLVEIKSGSGLESSNTFIVHDSKTLGYGALGYEIIRDSPLAINPWDGNDGAFTTNLKIKLFDKKYLSEYQSGDLSFTEILPPSITIIDSNGGAVWTNGLHTYITWNYFDHKSVADTGDVISVSYTAKPLKLSPDRYELQSFISMKGMKLKESRPWIVAVDPTNYYSAYSGSYAMYTSSGASASGGTYANTVARDCSGGTCTQVNSYVTGITGFGGAGANCMMNVTLLFNISDIKPIYLNSLSLQWGGCWHGDANLANPRCDSVNAPKFTTGTGGGTFDMWINQSGSFVKLDCVDNFNNECGSGNEINLGTTNNPPSWGNANSYKTFRFDKSVFNSTYVNNGIVAIRWRTWGVGVCGDGAGTNILMALDYANITVNWSYLIKSGMVSMVPGTEPFYTITANPYSSSNDSCLMNMLSGKACNITWTVNATGGINTSHVFYVIGDSLNYNTTVLENTSKNITLTIRDTSKVPPTVTLNSPANNNATQNGEIFFNCSATDNSGLVNMTLYGNFTGVFDEYVTNDLYGLSNSTIFDETLSEGRYSWNCLAEDIDGNLRFAASNRTVIVDFTEPTINLTYPDNGANMTTRTINLNFTVTDNIDTSLNCNITYDSNATYFTGITANSGTIISRTVYNITNGDHYWNVTCIDDAGNANTSETRMFTLLSTPPVVVLQTIDNYMTNQPDVNLFYFADDGGYITQADIYINGVLSNSTNTVTTGGTNSFTVRGLSEGMYNWTVNVTNDGGLTSQATPKNFFVEFSAPTINVTFPQTNYQSNSSTVVFNFTTTDRFDSLLSCKITINGIDVATGINAVNGSPTTKSVPNIKNGLNYWNITCQNDAGNSNTSDTRVLNVSAVPAVALNTPANNTFQKSENITLYYTPSGSNNMSNCTLILNGVRNQTNSTISLGSQNSFKLTYLAEGNYTWSVNCTDTTGYAGLSVTRLFGIDKTAPTINLTKPIGGETVYGSSTVFNFTAYDNLDPFVTCSLIIDGTTNKTNIIALNGQWVNVSVPIGEGNHSWSVSCMDHALNSNTSKTENFTVIGAPTLNIVFPSNNTILNYSNNVNFTYIPSSGNSLLNATLYINGVFNKSVNSPSNGNPNTFFLNFTDGIYNWSIIMFDSVGLNGSSGTNVLTIDTSVPQVNIMTPTQGQTIGVNNVTFKFNVTDNLANPIVCNITVPNQIVWSNISVSNGGTVTRSKILDDGNYNWSVTCVDNANNTNTYVLINFTVFAPPNVTLNFPTPNYRTRLQNVTFNYTPMDDIGFNNCTLFINGAFINSSNSVVRNVPNYFDVYNLAQGDYNWTVNCVDSAPSLNSYTPNVRNFTIDQTSPTITMLYPGINESINSNTVTFNWTATDYPVNITCMMFIDSVYNRTLTQMSGTYFTPVITNFSSGVHNWSLNCSDDLNNSIVSGTRNFTINNADLYLDSGRIYFSNTNPNENQSISISANVTNIGGVPANNVLVEFYDGDKGAGGIFIGNATGSVSVNGSTIFTVNWNITIGYHTIYVYTDPYDSVSELSNLNNNATKTISLLRTYITAPINGSMFVNPNVSVTFEADDFTGGIINYSIYVDNVLNGQNGSINDGTPYTINVTIAQGTHSIKIGTMDALGRQKNSTAIYVIIDYSPPNSTILTINQTWFNYTTPNINITSKDNMDTNINYTIYVNGSVNILGNISNGSSILIPLNALGEGSYELIMGAFDDFNNSANSTPKIIYVDLTPPSIVMNSPVDGANYTARSVILNYTPTDNMAYNASCSLTLDGNVVSSNTITIGNATTYTANNLAEGRHYWNVTCSDQALNTNTGATRSFNVYISPLITVISPPNNNWSASSTNIFSFNISDETGFTNCSIIINGTINQTKTTSQLANNATNNFTLNVMTSGTYNWSIECYDNTTYHAYNNTINRTLNVDLLSPDPYIETANNSWFNTGTPSIKFNISDNMDTLIDYTFYVNGTPNVSGTISNGGSTSVNLVNLQNGTYLVILQAVDNAGNSKNSTPIIIYVDTVKPSINLTSPLNATNITSSTLSLNFTPSDNMASNLLCNLTLDGNIIASNLSVNNGQNQNVTVSNLVGGYHYWNVTCMDNALNINTSSTNVFYVVMPDLYVNTSYFYFSNIKPVENETVNITATIFNFGQAAAQNFTVEMRVNGLTGTLIYNGTMSLALNGSANISANYTMQLGDTTFFILVDTPFSTNGTIIESNESNNNASATLHVGLWEYIFGNTNDRLVMSDYTNQTIFDWLVSNASGSKLFATDIDSTIHWRTLQALGRNTSNQTSPSDFYTLDTKLGSVNFSDSVNRTYTSSGSPIETTNYTIYTKDVDYVPIVNSTNNTNFKTGILWDYNAGTSYNGSQDVLFVSPIHKNAQGYNATVDYEIRVPASLRSYKAGQDVVVFYVEIS